MDFPRGPRAAILPVGELSSEQLRREYAAVASALRGAGVDLDEVEAVADEASARAAVAALAGRHPDFLVLVPLRGLSARTIEAAADAGALPTLIWPVEGRYALPSSALAVGALRQSARPVQMVYAPPDNPIAGRTIQCFSRAAHARARLGGCRVGTLGNLFPNLVSCRWDAGALAARLGVSVVPVDYERVREAMRRFTPAEVALDPSEPLPLEPGIRLHLALKRIAAEERLDGYAAECWSGLPAALGLNPCLGFREDAYALACEGDVLLCVALLGVRWLTGASAYAGDLYECDLEGAVTLVHCGGPASLAGGSGEVVLGRSRRATERGFETVTCRPDIPHGPVTLLRLHGPGADALHLAAADLVACETSPDLTVRVRLRGDRWDFLRSCTGNHYVVAAGDIRDELRLLAEWTGIAIHET